MVLVTGGTGLVGSHLIVELLDKGIAVKALKRKDSDTRIVNDLAEFYKTAKNAHLEWVDGDVLDFYSLKDALKGVRHVYHAAALVTFNSGSRKQLREVNEGGTINALNASLEEGLEKFCFVSSISTLGNSINGYPVDETCVWQPDDEHYPYAESKFRAEMEVKRAAAEGLKTIIVNPSFVIGPGRGDRSSGQIFKKVKHGLAFYTPGATGFVHARDVARAMIELMDSDIENESFILNGENRTLKVFLEEIALKTKSKAPYVKAGKTMLDVAWRLESVRSKLSGAEPLITKVSAKIARTKYEYSSEKFVRLTGFKFRTMEEAVADTVAFMEKFGY